MPEFGVTMGLHGTTHQEGGDDEVNVEDLSGELADEQKSSWTKVSGKPSTFTPSAHKASHQNGGGDEISVEGLSGILADRQDADKLMGRPISTAAPTDGQGYVYDAALNLWKPANISPVTKHTDLTDKEVGGIIDHADASVSTDKLVSGAVTQIQKAIRITQFSTTFTYLVDIPDLSITMTTGANYVLVFFQPNLFFISGNYWLFGAIDVDGTAQVSSNCGGVSYGNRFNNLIWLGLLSAAEHTIKARMRVTGGTGYIDPGTDGGPAGILVAVEIKR